MSELPDAVADDRVRDPKILDRLLEWTRTADEKASRLALIAVGLSLFWIYYGFIVPRSAKQRVGALEADARTVDGLIDRFADLRARYRDLALPKRRRVSSTAYPVAFFADVALPGIEADRTGVSAENRRLALQIKERLEHVAALVEAYRVFVARHPEVIGSDLETTERPPASLDTSDPTAALTNLIAIEDLITDLHRVNTTAANTEWVEGIQRVLASKRELVPLPNTFTATLAIYEPLVGTWVRDGSGISADSYRKIASEHGERVPQTLSELMTLRQHLSESLAEARHDLHLTRLRIPFTSIDVDRATVLVGGPILILLLFHYAASYLLLASALEAKTLALWGSDAEVIARDYRPSDAVFHRLVEDKSLPRPARILRDSLWLAVRVIIPATPLVVLLIAAVAERHGTESSFQRYTLMFVYTVLSAYAVATALAFWRATKRRKHSGGGNE